MVEGGENGVVPDERVIADRDPALVLKAAPGVDEDPLPQGDVLPEVRVERGKHGHSRIDRASRQLGQQRANLIGFVVAAVDYRRDAQGFLAGAVHDLMQRRAARDRLSGVECFQQICCVHGVTFPVLTDDEIRAAAGP